MLKASKSSVFGIWESTISLFPERYVVLVMIVFILWHSITQDNMSRSDDPNDYVVHDPLLEKGKEKFNKMQAREKRKQREWAGKSLT